MAKVSKNAKTNRKSLVNMFKGQKVKPVKCILNSLGVTVNGHKIPAGSVLAVQLENGSLMMEGEKIVLWHDIAHLIEQK